MRKLCMALATVCALTTTTPLLAAERTEFQISPRAGRGVLKLDQFRNVDETSPKSTPAAWACRSPS